MPLSILKMTEFNHYLRDVVEEYDAWHPQLRWGQIYIYVLSKKQPNLVRFIVKNRKLDPFYNDKKIEEFLVFVRENWGNYD
jgi:hypothetical protein